MHLYRFKPGRRGETAFTLIELLVTIGIIAILAALLFPALGKVREGGNRAKCMANMRQLSAAYLLMVGDKNGELVPTDNANGGDGPWANSIAPYLGFDPNSTTDWKRLSCPTVLAGMLKAGADVSNTTITRATYGLNSQIGSTLLDAKNPGSVAMRMSQLTQPSATILIGDTKIQANADPKKFWTNSGVQSSSIYAWHGDFPTNYTISPDKNKFAICYFDGHTAFVDQALITSMNTTKGTAGSAGSIFWNGL